MNFLLSILPVLAFPCLACAETPEAKGNPSEKPARWTVTGDWIAKHPKWDDTITLRQDGTFSRGHGEGGKWRLTVDVDRPVLQLDWKDWNAETVEMITGDLFRGSARSGVLELRRATTADAVAVGEAKPQPAAAKEVDDPALRARLSDSVWRLQDGKKFTLKADGSTSGDWHERKGSWRIVGRNQVELTILWRPKGPSTVSVESNGSLLRWPDSEWGQIARRVEPESPER
jgi:hypothetical protein